MSYSLRSLSLLIGFWLLLIGYGGLVEANPALEELIVSGNALAQKGEYEAAIRRYKQAWGLYKSCAWAS